MTSDSSLNKVEVLSVSDRHRFITEQSTKTTTSSKSEVENEVTEIKHVKYRWEVHNNDSVNAK